MSRRTQFLAFSGYWRRGRDSRRIHNYYMNPMIYKFDTNDIWSGHLEQTSGVGGFECALGIELTPHRPLVFCVLALAFRETLK